PMDDALSITVDAPVGDDRAKSIEGVCQESLSLNGEESPVEFNADEDKVDEELKGHEELAGEPVEQV
ncbi:MAG: hypothetical protein OEW25_04695, partial [Nitrospira sp.]|nr:hypothetical protein [Nitrospira sp.]